MKTEKIYLIIIMLVNLFIILSSFALLTKIQKIVEIIIFIILAMSSIYLTGFLTKYKLKHFILMMFVFTMMIVNSIFLYFSINKLYLFVVIILNLLGFLILSTMIPSQKKQKTIIIKNNRDTLKKELKGLDIEEPEVIIEEIRPAVKTKEPKKRYLASKKSKVLHSENCPFTKIISKENIIYFNTKNKAIKQGYKLHECVE